MWMGLFKYMKLYQHLCDFLFVRKIFFSRSLHIMSSWHKEYLCLFLLCKSSEVNSQTAKIKCFHCSLFGQVVSWRSCSDLRIHPFVMHAGSSPHNHQFKNFILWESKKAQIWCNRPILTPTHKDCGCIAKNFDIFQMAAWHLSQFSLLEIFSINIHNVEEKKQRESLRWDVHMQMVWMRFSGRVLKRYKKWTRIWHRSGNWPNSN